ncbi:MAG: DegT/DnrJ/EryC1/StrS family aminotransferase [Patescibacteria group bacterium]
MNGKISSPILVTGGSGFIGANLVRRLIEDENNEVHLILRNESDTWRLSDILDKVKVHRVDLVEREKIFEAVREIKPKTIFHLAVYGAYPFQKESSKIKTVNLDGTINLIEAGREVGFDIFINTGSSSEYGFKNEAMKEIDRLEPNSHYAIYKAAATMLCQYLAQQENLPIITLRPFSVYGPYEEPTRLISKLVVSLLNNICPPLVSPKTARDYIYIDDVIDLYLAAAKRPELAGEIFNMGRGQQVDLEEIVATAIKIIGADVEPKWGTMPSRNWDQNIWQADISKTVKLLDWQPKNDLETGLKKTISWFRDNQERFKDRYICHDEIRETISELVKKSWPITSMKGLDGGNFIPGKSPVQYSGPTWNYEEVEEAIYALLRGKWLSKGENVAKFENEFSTIIGRSHSIMCNSGSSANLLMLSALKSDKTFAFRDIEVITPVVCFPTTVAPIIQCGFTPKFIDVEMDTLNLDLDLLEQAITAKTKAVIFAHVLGNPPDMDRLVDICRRNNLILLEDNCDSLGSSWNGKPLGSFGLMSSHSFYPAHHITTGEGGMVSTNDENLAKVISSMINWGRACYCVGAANFSLNGNCAHRFDRWLAPAYDGIVDHKYVYDEIGYNLKPLDFQGAIGSVQLKKLADNNKNRKKIFQKFYEVCGKYPELVKMVRVDPRAEVSWFGFPLTIITDKFIRNDFINFLESRKIQTRNYFSGNILFHKPFAYLGNPKNYPNACQVMERTFFIGVQPKMTEEMIEYVCQNLDEFLGQYK